MTHPARLAPLFLFALVFALLLGACQSDVLAPDRDAPSGDLEALDPNGALVVYWHTLTGDDEARLLEMIDDFNTGNEWGITVVGEYQGDGDTLFNRIVEGLSTGQLPNLVQTDPGFASAYAARDAAVALSPYLESKKWGFTQAERDDFFPSALTAERLRRFNNELYGFSFCHSLQVLYYNADWLRELDYDAPPQTWDEFRAVACAASQPANGLYGYEIGMDSLTFLSVIAAQQASLLNADATAYILGGEVGRATLEFLQSLIQEGCAQWETEQGPVADFGVGKVLFTIGSTDALPIYQQMIAKEAGFNWSLAPIPHTTEQPVVGVYGSGLTILRGTPKEQLAAWLFVKWLAEPEQQARWAQETGCFPTRQSALTLLQDYVAEHPQYGQASLLLSNEWVTEPGVPDFAACRAEIGRMLYAVTAGQDVNRWLEDTRNFCNQTLPNTVE